MSRDCLGMFLRWTSAQSSIQALRNITSKCFQPSLVDAMFPLLYLNINPSGLCYFANSRLVLSSLQALSIIDLKSVKVIISIQLQSQPFGTDDY